MTPVRQEERNDCMRACIASILNLSLDEVPDFYAGLTPGDVVPDEVTIHMDQWFEFLRIKVIWFSIPAKTQKEAMSAVNDAVTGVHYIMCGNAEREAQHAVVCKNGRMVWNPARNTGELTGPTADGTFHVYMMGYLI